ncbi:MAG: hypothetical protein HYV35_05445, partial [Lentisphaerae bacterium]|nr:hypothetical protein [Lentisphaerota bacterium]
AVSLLNPNGWRGLLYPLSIFGNYCLAITENASPLSYWETVLNPMLATLPLLSLVALLVFWRALLPCRSATPLARFSGIIASRGEAPTGSLILLVALFAAWGMLRSAPLLALTLLPALGLCLGIASSKVAPKGQNNSSFGHISLWTHFIKCVHVFLKDLLPWMGIILVITINLWLAWAVVEGAYARVFPSPIGPTPFGFDDESRYMALRRLREEGLPAPVFSDYNSGSLVEYNFYPEPGYVDNRPEAFPAEFWQQEYGPALALGAVWEEMLARRNFQTVAVSIPGVKEGFIRTLLADSRWQLVHLDFFYAVFVRNTPANRDFLRRHAFGPEQVRLFAGQTAQRLRDLSNATLWRRQVLADQIVYEIYALICVGAHELAWPLVWEMHLRYPDYQLIHELLRVSAPPYAFPAVMEVMARRARWPLAAKQVLDYGAALEAQGRTDEARAVYRRGKIFFPFSRELQLLKRF